jgi:hypothetical protein
MVQAFFVMFLSAGAIVVYGIVAGHKEGAAKRTLSS